MYRRRLSEQEFADELEDLEVTHRQSVGSAHIIAGESPSRGALMLIQTINAFAAMYERPEGDEHDYEPSPAEVQAHRERLFAFVAGLEAELRS